MNPLNAINGWKTYAAGAVAAFLALDSVVHILPGEWHQGLLAAALSLGFVGVRHALSKATAAVLLVLLPSLGMAQTVTVYTAVGPARSPIPHTFAVFTSATGKERFCVSWVPAGSRPTLHSSCGKNLSYADTIKREQAFGSHVICNGTAKISQARYDLAVVEWNRLQSGSVHYRATALIHDATATNCIGAVKEACGLRFPGAGRIGGAEIVRQLEKHP